MNGSIFSAIHNLFKTFTTMDKENDAEVLSNAKEGPILDYAINYTINGTYPSELTKEKKRSVRKRARTLISENREVYLKRKGRRVKVIRRGKINC